METVLTMSVSLQNNTENPRKLFLQVSIRLQNNTENAWKLFLQVSISFRTTLKIHGKCSYKAAAETATKKSSFLLYVLLKVTGVVTVYNINPHKKLKT
jgi:hypothetical protein